MAASALAHPVCTACGSPLVPLPSAGFISAHSWSLGFGVASCMARCREPWKNPWCALVTRSFWRKISMTRTFPANKVTDACLPWSCDGGSERARGLITGTGESVGGEGRVNGIS